MKRIIRISLMIFATAAILAAIIISSAALYMRFFGGNILQKTLSDMLGAPVKFEKMFLDKESFTVDFKGFRILSKINLGENIFNAEEFTLHLNKELFEKDRKILIEQILIKRGALNIERNIDGVFNLSDKRGKESETGLAYAQAAPDSGQGGFYGFATKLKNITIEDSIVDFKDYYIARPPFTVTCDNLNLQVISGGEPTPQTGSIPVRCTLNFTIPNQIYGSGQVSFEASAAAYPGWVDMDTTLEAKHIDAMQFLPYFERHTPFSFKEGLFSSSTHFEVHNRVIKSLTTMVFHRLNLAVAPGKRNTTFLEASVERLTPYLMSGKGEIIFDFVINGPMDNPEIGVGPKVKFAIGMVVMEEVGNILQELQKAR